MSEAFQPDDKKRIHAGLFDATRWSLVQRARDKSEAALGTLCESYRQPLLTWLKIRGYSSHDAEDAVHDFVGHILTHDFLDNVAKEKGSFRTFLLRCLKNHLRDQHVKRTAAKRGGGAVVSSLDETSEEGQRLHDPPDEKAMPDVEYDRAWAQTILTNSLHQLKVECARQGHGTLYAELETILFADETAPAYLQIAVRLNMTEGAVKVAAYRIRNRLKGILREEVRQTVTNEADWQDEIRYLMQLFGR